MALEVITIGGDGFRMVKLRCGFVCIGIRIEEKLRGMCAWGGKNGNQAGINEE